MERGTVMGNIIVQLADPQWTTQALHLASALARNTGSHVTFLHLMLARNPGLLGSEMATPAPTWAEQDQFREYGTICEDYGVDCVLQPMQYVSLTGALQDAAMLLKARAFFVKKPDSHFTLWNRFWAWRLHQVMRSTGCQLYLVDTNTRMIDWVPTYLSSADVDHPLTAEVLN